MSSVNWHYDTATDSGLRFVDRLKSWPREPDPLVYAARIMAAVAIRGALRTFLHFEISGREHLPRDRSFVLVANHASHLDAVSLLSALPLRSLHHAYPLAARDYFCANNLRLVFAAVVANAMMFDRDSTGLNELKRCRRLLEGPGNVLVMFPEGTRSLDGGVGVFRRGIGSLVAGAPFPVVPCYLDGTFTALPKGAFFPRPARVRLSIGEARTYERVNDNQAGVLHICSDLRGAVLALAPRIQPHTARPLPKEAYL